jgi:hypothetical protein
MATEAAALTVDITIDYLRTFPALRGKSAEKLSTIVSALQDELIETTDDLANVSRSTLLEKKIPALVLDALKPEQQHGKYTLGTNAALLPPPQPSRFRLLYKLWNGKLRSAVLPPIVLYSKVASHPKTMRCCSRILVFKWKVWLQLAAVLWQFIVTLTQSLTQSPSKFHYRRQEARS